MSEQIVLRIYEIVGSSLCVASEDGQKVFQQITKAIDDGKNVSLSFKNVESLTSAFLNAAIGQLYGKYSHELLKKSLSVRDMEQDDLLLLSRVVDTAKKYFQDPEVIEAAKRNVMGDNEDDE